MTCVAILFWKNSKKLAETEVKAGKGEDLRY